MRKMRKPIMLSGIYNNVAAIFGSGVKAWVYGSVAKGTATSESDLDIYISGPLALKIEKRFYLDRPKVFYNERVYSAHIIGPLMVSEADFLSAQPEAIRIL